MRFHMLAIALILSACTPQEGTVPPASGGPIVIDVRSQAEWDAGHLEQAVHIPHTRIGEEISGHVRDKSREILLHCRSGGRSGMAQRVLEEMGYTNVKNLGGLEEARAFLKK